MKLAHLACAFAIVGSGCSIDRMLIPEPRPVGVPQDAFKMPAVYAVAGKIALDNFLENERREDIAASAHDAGTQDAPPGGGGGQVRNAPEPGGGRVALDGGVGAMSSGGSEPSTVTPVQSCFARPESYDVYVSFVARREIYRVFILPVPEVCLGKDAHALIGGGAIYEIDARSFQIQSRQPLE